MKKYIGVLFMIAAMGLPSFVLAGMEGLSISIKPLINESGSSKIGLLLTNKGKEAVQGKIIMTGETYDIKSEVKGGKTFLKDVIIPDYPIVIKMFKK